MSLAPATCTFERLLSYFDPNAPNLPLRYFWRTLIVLVSAALRPGKPITTSTSHS